MLADILRERFDWGAYWHLEGADQRELTDEESGAVDRFEKLSETVSDISPSLLDHAGHLAGTHGARFETMLQQMIARVGRGYYPETAEDFVLALSNALEAASVAAASA